MNDFVGLLHMNDGKWDYVSNAEVVDGGKNIKFYVDDLSPFAIVTKYDTPTTGDAGVNPVWIAMTVASFLGLVALFVISKKTKANEA